MTAKLTPKQAVEHLRRAAGKMDNEDGVAVVTLIDHTLRLEQSLQLLRASFHSVEKDIPPNAVLSDPWERDRQRMENEKSKKA